MDHFQIPNNFARLGLSKYVDLYILPLGASSLSSFCELTETECGKNLITVNLTYGNDHVTQRRSLLEVNGSKCLNYIIIVIAYNHHHHHHHHHHHQYHHHHHHHHDHHNNHHHHRCRRPHRHHHQQHHYSYYYYHHYYYYFQ